jgi:hypothetical protein
MPGKISKDAKPVEATLKIYFKNLQASWCIIEATLDTIE